VFRAAEGGATFADVVNNKRQELDEELEEDDGDKRLDDVGSFNFRSQVMRGAFLSLDRPDIAYTIKELARAMSKPTVRDQAALKRLSRYLLGAKRLIWVYPWKSVCNVLTIETDSDFAGCQTTRKSTSCFAMFWSGSLIKFQSKTQSVVATSTQEAEFYSLCSATSAGLGMQGVFQDLGLIVEVNLHSDASAGIALAIRRGLGRCKHIAVQYLWIQRIFSDAVAKLHKVGTDKNRSDAGTKHLTCQRMRYLLGLMNLCFESGDHTLALRVGAFVKM
jgi:hypothetical protein